MRTQEQEACSSGGNRMTCTCVSAQYADVCVPIRLKPYAIAGKLVTECCGEPVIVLRPDCGCGCELTITQSICVKIPLEYGTESQIGDTITNCKKTSNCSNIGTDPGCR